MNARDVAIGDMPDGAVPDGEIPDDELMDASGQPDLYSSLFGILPDAVLVHCEGRVAYANGAAARLWGAAAPEELFGRDSIELVAEASRAAVIELRAEVSRTGTAREIGSYRIERLDGVEYEVEGYCAPFTWGEEPATISVVRDLTKLKQAEQELQAQIKELEQTKEELRNAKETADSANRTKSEFLANMSHELRTPLNAIMGFSEVIKDEMFGPIGLPQYVEYSRDIYDSGSQLLDIINDILDLSKVEAGKFELSEGKVDLVEVVGVVVSLIKVRSEEKRLTLEVLVSGDMPLLFADKRSLKQMLLNLLSNAVKFTPVGGHIHLTCFVGPDDEVRIAVRDSGIGIAHGDFQKVLAPFGQVDSSLSRDHQGTGLGLPLVKAMVEMHGGHMALESVVGIGTKTTLCFPASRTIARVRAA